MKKLLVFLVILIAVIVLADRTAAFVLDQLYRRTLTGQTGGKINQYLNASEKFDFVIFGISRALYQIIPDSIAGNGFNISHAGMGPAFQTGLISILAQEKKIPKRIILHIEPYELNEIGQDATVQNLKYYYGKSPFVTRSLNDLSRYERWKFSMDLYRHNGRIISLLKNFHQTRSAFVPSNGYDQIPQTSRDSINTIYSFEKLDKNPAEKINRQRLHQLERFLNVANGNNTEVIAFTSPTFHGLNYYPKTTYLIDSLLHSKNIRYLNLSRPKPTLTENPLLWKDVYHLNHKGAQELSSVLAAAIDSLKEK